jgi:hypothetical protein
MLEVNESVPIVRPDDGPIGPKHVALNVLFMVIIDALNENINALYNFSVLEDVNPKRSLEATILRLKFGHVMTAQK